MRLQAGNGTIEIDGSGNVTGLTVGKAAVKLPLAGTFFEVDGAPVRLEPEGQGAARGAGSTATREGGEFAVVGLRGEQALPLRLKMSGGRDLRIEPVVSRGEPPQSWSLTVALPLSAEIHLPEYPNVGRKLDSSIPVADFYAGSCFYNFLLVGCDGVWIRFLSEQRRVGRLSAHVERHDRMFLLTVSWSRGRDDADGYDAHAFDLTGRIALYASMADATADYERYLADEVGVRERPCGNPLPDWVGTTPLFVAVDLMRCFGQIENDYAAVADIARALKRHGAPKETVIHIVGWNGAFDTAYPTYLPIDELGGEAAFRDMIAAIKECGFRFSAHVNGCAFDPWHPQIDELMPLVARDGNGNVRGYKLAEDKSPPSRRIRFRTPELAVTRMDARRAVAEIESPALCESTVVVGGLPANAAISVTINRRTQKLPPGPHARYTIPLPMHLNAGINVIELTSPTSTDWSSAWVRIDGGFAPNFVHAIGTIPLLIADTTRDDWIALLADAFARLVKEYGLDLLYIDYTTFYHPPGAKKLFERLCDRLPDTPFWVEWCDSIEELGYAAFCGGSNQHLVKTSPKLRELAGRKSIPVTRGIIERYGWLDSPSPVCDFTKRYTRFTAGGAFVPVNSVASLYDNRLVYADPSELRENLDGASRLNFLPILHFNYKEYGIDDYAARFIRDLGREKRP